MYDINDSNLIRETGSPNYQLATGDRDEVKKKKTTPEQYVYTVMNSHMRTYSMHARTGKKIA